MLTADFVFSEIRTHKTAALFTGATSALVLLFFLPGVVRWAKGIVSPVDPVQQTTRLDQDRTMKALTNAGTSVCSTISYDGKLLAHAEEQNGKQQLLVTNTGSSGSSVAVPPDEVQYVGITFSRDNSYLYFTRKEKDGAGILYRLAWPSGNAIELKKDVAGPISLSPQGDRFAFVRYNEETTEYSLMLSDIDGTNEQVVASRKNGDTLSVHGVAWAPDGATVVCPAGYWRNGFHMNVIGFDLKTGREQLLGNQTWFSVLQVAWQEGTASLIISARERETSPHQLWRIGVSDGTAQQITYDLAEYRGVSLSGENIVTVRTNLSWRIWVSSLGDLQTANPIVTGVGLRYGLSWTGKGKVVFSSMAQERLNISRIDTDGSHQVQLTANAGDNYTPASSSDGALIVFASNRNGPFNIWRMNAEDGSNPTQLTFGDGSFYPSCSPDSQWVAYDNQVDSRLSVWKVPLEGGLPVKLGEKYRMPVFSPNNQFIACRYDLESGSRDAAIFSAQGGRPLRRFPIPVQEWQRIQWLAGGRQVSYIKNVNGYSNIWSYDLDTGATKQLTNFNSEQIYAYAWSPDYKQVACQRGTKISDVTMVGER